MCSSDHSRIAHMRDRFDCPCASCANFNKRKETKTSRKIKVTKRHIKEGDPGSDHSCPIALAIIEAFEKDGYSCDDVEVGGDYIRLDASRSKESKIKHGSKTVTESISFTVDAPKFVERFIEDFDEGCEVKPIEITLPV